FYSERNREYPLDRPVTSLGRARENTIVIRDDRVAAHHVRVWREGESYVLESLSGETPTYVNGEPVAAGRRVPLAHADFVSLASLDFEFCAETRRDANAPRLWVTGGVHRGKVFRLPDAGARLGRAPENDVQFPDRSVSRHHCASERAGGEWRIEDLGSTNGTVVNWRAITEPVTLHEGDEVALGFSTFVFHETGELREAGATLEGAGREHGERDERGERKEDR
ncbi:MAG: FHA domain-containing protein, partial [Gemmatimonadota bacterium]